MTKFLYRKIVQHIDDQIPRTLSPGGSNAANTAIAVLHLMMNVKAITYPALSILTTFHDLFIARRATFNDECQSYYKSCFINPNNIPYASQATRTATR